MSTCREMPKYKCHKEVRALKIAAVERHKPPVFSGAVCRGCFKFNSACRTCERCEWERATGGKLGATITPFESPYTNFDVPAEWLTHYKGAAADLGYYVVYDDGYASWSPNKAFEDGYTRMD